MNIKKSTSIFLLVIFALGVFIQSASAAPGDIALVSLNQAGLQFSNHSLNPKITADGQFVFFISNSIIYRRDLVSGVTSSTVSSSSPFEISSDGQLLVYRGVDSRIYVYNLQTATTTLVSKSSSGVTGNNSSDSPSISADGRYVVFASNATNLVSDDTNSWQDIFMHDLQTSTTTRISVTSDGTQLNQLSFYPSISGNGRYVVFSSRANNLVNNDTNGIQDIFLKDTQTGAISRLSVNSIGEESTGFQGINYNDYGVISEDGKFVAMKSSAWNLVGNTHSGVHYIYLRDIELGTTIRISNSNTGGLPFNSSFGISISADGQYITYTSDASNIVFEDTNGYSDVFVYDRLLETTKLISSTSDGIQGTGSSGTSDISSNGNFTIFASTSTNLVSNDTNNSSDIFRRENLMTNLSIINTANRLTNSANISFAVRFAEPVTNVNISDFILTTSGTLSGISITEVTGSGKAYIVNVSTGSGDGTIRLDIPSSATIFDESSNLISQIPYSDGEVYTVDRTNPIVSSITRTDSNPSNTSSVKFTVTFSENVSGVNLADFVLTKNGTLSGTSLTSISGSGSIYTITTNTGSGEGELRLDLLDDDSIKDGASNFLGGSGTGNGNFNTGELYNIIRSMPNGTILLITPKQKTIINITTPTFTWTSPLPASTYYELQISTNRTFTNILVSESTNQTSHTINTLLLDGLYYWRARAFNGGFSAAQYFTVDTTPPVVPTLTSPRNTAILKTTPNFRWTRVSGATLFEFRYDDSADCASPLYTFTTRYNYHKPPAISAGIYYWCVSAKDTAGNWSNFSTPSSFTISP